MHSERLKYLLDGYLAKTLSLPEMQEFMALVKQADADPLLNAMVEQIARQEEPDNTISQSQAQVAIAGIVAVDKKIAAMPDDGEQSLNAVKRIPSRRKWYYAAAAVLVVAFGSYLWNQQSRKTPDTAITQTTVQPDIAPGMNRATLTLADGTTVMLDSASNGTLAVQGNTRVIKLANGQVAYDLKGEATSKVMMNTMRTPRGGQFQLTLPDGTKVWLNAASSITYPAAFAGKERRVKITGEVYFEVTSIPLKPATGNSLRAETLQPFIVDIEGRSSVEVLGTRFNINAYDNEATIKTSLVEGAVRVTSEKAGNVLLKPGQQAQLSPTASRFQVQTVNMDQVLAWKNGMFNFNEIDIQSLMRQIERWYDIEVRYEGTIPNLRFGGELTRDLQLSQMLKILGKMDVKFRMEARTIVVSGIEGNKK